MPDHRHRGRARHAGAFEGAHGRAAEVMKQLSGVARLLAGGLPRLPKVLDRRAIRPMEHVGADGALLFEPLDGIELRRQDCVVKEAAYG